METLLLVVTIVSLALALVSSLLAWRLTREERLRSAARIAALSADIADTRPPHARSGETTVPAWRDDDDTVAGVEPEATVAAELPLHDAPVALAGGLFAGREPSTSRFRLVAVVAAGALVVATVIGTLVAFSGPPASAKATARQGDRAEATRAAAPEAPAARTATEVPLELVALGHERQADRLTVRGVVRNPAIGAELNQLQAVVFLFNRDGGFIASGSAEVDRAAVAPGAERTFVVSLPAGADVGRYRVSFRSADHVIPHVDKRS